MSAPRRKGSALVMVIWTIAVLSVLVVSFAVEAKLQSAANVYMREKVRMNYLIDAGKVLAEMIIAEHQKVPDFSESENIEELLGDNRWIEEQRQLKRSGSSALIGPIAVDELNPEKGTVKVEIKSVGGGEGGGPKINVNTLHPGGNRNYLELWEAILFWAGVPEEDHDLFVHSWVDWIDQDDVAISDAHGGESEFYEDLCKQTGEEKYKPRNGAIADLKELAKVRGFREHPALLTGGYYYDIEEVKAEDNIPVKNILNVLDVYGGEKINVNTASMDVLMCIPGIRNPDDPTDEDDIAAAAIMNWRNGLDLNGEPVDLTDEQDGTLIKDWGRLMEVTDGLVKPRAQEFLSYSGGQGDGTLYELTITAETMGMRHTVKAKMTIRQSKPVYIEWRESP